MKTRKLTFSALLTAIGVIAGNIIFIPVGVSKCFPVQHTINVLSAVILGPYYGVAIAFCISLIRNMVGTGSLLAFPGSMIGALLAGVIFYKTKNVMATAAAEVFGTGILGGLLAFPISYFVLGKKVAALFYVAPFLISTVGGSIIAYFIIKILESTKIISLNNQV
ncbi:MAG: energy coupling factor transporter component ThiW [Clostridiaceae bacterium]|jgi:energy coupling factor transporter S component ThiW|nr:energy coupling factor transporter component ThiW [Clostridiaceae bacterium]